MKSNRFLPAYALIAVLLGGCAAPSPSFLDMSQVYQSEVEKYQNNNLLLNVVRASKNMPLSFLDIPNVIGTGNLTTTVGLGAFIYGGAPSSVSGFFSPPAPSAFGTSSYYNPSASISVGRSFNFTLSSLQNAQFQKGFLEKISLDVVHFFTSDHVSKELLFLLLIDSFEFVAPDGQRNNLSNNPLLPGYADFQKQLRKLVDGGLTTEQITSQVKVGPPMRPDQLLDGNGLVSYVGLAGKNIVLQDISNGNQKLFQLFQNVRQVRFCFAPTKYESEIVEYFGEGMLCQNPLGIDDKKRHATSPLKADMKKSKAAPKPLLISLRSTKDVFQYLGEVYQGQVSSKNPYTVGLRQWADKGNSKLELTDDLSPLFVISAGAPKERVVANISYDGSEYYVSAQNSGYSVYVINLLSQLVNLLKIPGSIPASPAVLIK
jgi:hypothetical protein